MTLTGFFNNTGSLVFSTASWQDKRIQNRATHKFIRVRRTCLRLKNLNPTDMGFLVNEC